VSTGAQARGDELEGGDVVRATKVARVVAQPVRRGHARTRDAYDSDVSPRRVVLARCVGRAGVMPTPCREEAGGYYQAAGHHYYRTVVMSPPRTVTRRC
jgi:hypothetical protein